MSQPCVCSNRQLLELRLVRVWVGGYHVLLCPVRMAQKDSCASGGGAGEADQESGVRLGAAISKNPQSLCGT